VNGPQRARLLGVVAGVLILGALSGYLRQDDPAPPAAGPARVAPVDANVGTSDAQSPPVSDGSPRRWPPDAAQAPASAAPAAPPAVAVAGRVPGREVWDLCGVGRMPVPPGTLDPEQPPAPLVAQPLEGWRERWLAQLANGTPRQRALGELLQARETLGAEAQAHWQRVVDLARANAGADPVLLQWALGGCDEVGAAACQGLPARRLTEAAPDSAAAWLLRLQRDPGLAAEATERLRAASAVSPQQGQAAATALQALPAGLPSYLRPELLSWAVGVDSGMEADEAYRLQRWCLAPGLPAAEVAERETVCDHLARATVVAGPSETQVRAALRVGRRLGWPDSALQEAAQRLEALTAWAQTMSQDPQPYACATVERFDRWVADVPTLGRLQALSRLRQDAASAAAR